MSAYSQKIQLHGRLINLVELRLSIFPSVMSEE